MCYVQLHVAFGLVRLIFRGVHEWIVSMGGSRSYFEIRYLAESKCHSGMDRSARAWAGANKGMDYFSRRRKLERARFYPYLFLPSDYFSRHKVSYEH